MDIERKSINKGRELCLINNESMNSILLCQMYYMPLDKEASKNAIISKLLMRGTAIHKTAREIARFLYGEYGAGAGIDISLKGEVYTLGLYLSYVNPHKYLKDSDINLKMTGFLKEVFYSPLLENGHFKQDYFSTEKTNLINEIDSKINNKEQYAFLRCCQEMCKGEPYSIDRLGEKKWAESITQKEAVERFLYIRDNCPSVLYVMGDIDSGQMQGLLEGSFSSAPTQGIKINPPYAASGNIKYIDELMDINQGKLFMGFRTETNLKDMAYPALAVANSLFGGGAHSILFKELREKNSLCYTVYSTIEKYQGMLFVMAGIDSKNKEKAQEGILKALDRLGKGDFSQQDFDTAITSTKHNLCTVSDNKNMLLSYIQGLDVYGCTYTLDELINSIDKVKREEVVECSRKIKLDTVYFLGGR
jgi:predicted Zn-dependent peptidase